MIVTLLATVTWLVACTTIPKVHFDAYQQSFAQVKVSTEDMLLQARVRTEAWARQPNNKTPAVERAQKVITWLAALDDRQAALDTIDNYNTVLVRLAAGEDPAAIEGSLKGISDGLTSFGSSSLSSGITAGIPYFGIASKLLAAVEGQVKRKEFERLIGEAQGPIADILQILIKDAPNLNEILVTEPELELNALKAQLVDIKWRFQGVASKFKSSAELEARYEEHNELRSSLNAAPKLPATKHKPATDAASVASASDLEILTLIIDQEREVIAMANALTEWIEAQGRVIKAYIATLEAMNGFFVAMNADFKQGKQQAAFEFVRRGLEYRKSIIELREGV